MTPRHFTPVAAILMLLPGGFVQADEDTVTVPPPAQAAERIDALLAEHWKQVGLEPVASADDAELLRRVTLDLIGRIPTEREVDRFLNDKKQDKFSRLIRQLLDGPEFPLHFGHVLDRMIQGKHAGSDSFVEYTRRSLRDGRSWDAIFRDLMLGPWDGDLKPASRFLDKRARDLDALTNDTARVFFGVDISCARCHDHPLVNDWTQDHYYGMSAFFNRTTGGKGKIGEKSDGEVKFVTADGTEKTARLMFLSGQKIDEPSQEEQEKTKFSRRQQLVDVALQDRRFISRSLVNRLWHNFFGRGLVAPVDQMHSGNEPTVPELLDWLADDFASSGYDLRRLVEVLVTTKAYRLSSVWTGDGDVPAPEHFAVFHLRPLTEKQMAVSLLVAVGDGSFDATDEPTRRAERYLNADGFARVKNYLALETRAERLTKSLDAPRRDFQSSAAEALFLSNAETVQQVIAASDNNLASRLAAIGADREVVAKGVKIVLGRHVGEDEQKTLVDWLGKPSEAARVARCEQLIWALVTSAEFRFNH